MRTLAINNTSDHSLPLLAAERTFVHANGAGNESAIAQLNTRTRGRAYAPPMLRCSRVGLWLLPLQMFMLAAKSSSNSVAQ